MRQYFRFFFTFLLFLLTVGIERVIGLPIFSLTFAGIWLSTLPMIAKTPSLFLLAAAIAIIFLLPFTVVLGCLCVILISLEYEGKFLIHRSSRFFLTVVTSCLIFGFLLHFSVSTFQIISFGLSSAVVLFFIRYWLYRHNSQAIMSVSG